MKETLNESQLKAKIYEMVSNELNGLVKEEASDSDAVLREIYQHLCDCQDLSESIGEWGLMSTFEELRHKVDRIRFSRD